MSARVCPAHHVTDLRAAFGNENELLRPSMHGRSLLVRRFAPWAIADTFPNSVSYDMSMKPHLCFPPRSSSVDLEGASLLAKFAYAESCHKRTARPFRTVFERWRNSAGETVRHMR